MRVRDLLLSTLMRAVVASFIGTTVGPLAAEDRISVVTVSGEEVIEGTIRQWTTDSLLIGGDSAKTLPLDEVVSLKLDRASLGLTGARPLVLLANGDRLLARTTVIADDQLTATWDKLPARGDIRIPLETVAAVVMNIPETRIDSQRLFADLKTLPPGNDTVLFTNHDLRDGEFEQLDETEVSIKGATGATKLNRNRVRAIRFNPELVAVPKFEGRRFFLTFTDGSRITASKVELKGTDLLVTTVSKLEFTLPVEMLTSCLAVGSRVRLVSELEPIRVEQTPYFSGKWPLVKNANVWHGPLTVRGVDYPTGFGVHSKSVMTFALPAKAVGFRSIVGIDDHAQGAGSVRFQVDMDGKQLWQSPEITGRSPALDTPLLNVSGGKELTLTVDFGDRFDVSDYADWCNTVLLMDGAK